MVRASSEGVQSLTKSRPFFERLIKSISLSCSMAERFHIIIEQDEDGGFIGKVPELQGCVSQGDTLDELMENMKEAIELCLEVETDKKVKRDTAKFIGVQEIIV